MEVKSEEAQVSPMERKTKSQSQVPSKQAAEHFKVTKSEKQMAEVNDGHGLINMPSNDSSSDKLKATGSTLAAASFSSSGSNEIPAVPPLPANSNYEGLNDINGRSSPYNNNLNSNPENALYRTGTSFTESYKGHIEKQNRPNFPAGSPRIFLDDEVQVISNQRFETTAEFESDVKCMKKIQLIPSPPKLYIRQIGYRYESASRNASFSHTPRPSSILANESALQEAPYISSPVISRNPTQTNTSEANAQSTGILKDGSVVFKSISKEASGLNGHNTLPPNMRKIKVMDIKTELTKFIDPSFLVYNPSSLSAFANDKQHSHKALKIYKYVASSKLKNVCSALRERLEGDFDAYDIRITNDEYEDRIPKRHEGTFYGTGCSKRLRWIMGTILFPLAPLIYYEYRNIKEYHLGLVFRIRKRDIGLIQNELIAAASEQISKLKPKFQLLVEPSSPVTKLEKGIAEDNSK